ncbi:MAG: E2/UBC family protein, partial [Candidatus Paceibacterota bacterium]
MGLLLEEDYEYLKECGIEWEQDEAKRFFIFKRFKLQKGIYCKDSSPLDEADILVIIPPNYNTSGGDMFWTYPLLSRCDGNPIPQTSPPTTHSKQHDGRIYCRWSRHWNKPNAWEPKVDSVIKILGRIEWALKNPNADR